MNKSEQVEKAKQNLEDWYHREGDDDCLKLAKAQALIAIAQELCRLNDKLDSITDGGDFPGLQIYATVDSFDS